MATSRLNSKDNSKRKFKGRGPRPDNTKFKQEEATERQAAWASFSPKEQLQILDRRPGESKRQRARIQASLTRPKPASPKSEAKEPESSETAERVKAKDRHAHEQKVRPSK